jgi:hypothetical protein
MEGPEMHVAKLIAITEVKNVPPDIRPFVEFKAAIEDRKLTEDERVAILVIDNTTCYVPVFLKDPAPMKRLEEELSKQDAKLAADTKQHLLEHLKQ